MANEIIGESMAVVTGSPLVPPTMLAVPADNAAVPNNNGVLLNEDLDLSALLEVLLGLEGRGV
jgi:hypothetical protein